MKLLFKFITLLTIISSTYLIADTSQKNHIHTLKSASELSYPPFATVTEDNKADGFSVELLRAVASSMKFKIDLMKKTSA